MTSQWMSPPCRTAAAAPAAAEQVAEQPLAEDVAEGLEDVADVAELRGAAPFQAGMAVAVVAGPLLRVAEHLEGLGRLLELRHRLVVARVAVGMVLQGQLAVGLGDLVPGGGTVHAEHFVIVAFVGHRCHIVAYTARRRLWQMRRIANQVAGTLRVPLADSAAAPGGLIPRSTRGSL